MRMKVVVKKKHIVGAVKESCTRCPIARAMKDMGLVKPEVNSNEASWRKNRVCFYTYLPQKARKFIVRFDDGKKVKPISFMVKIHEAWV